MAPKTAILARKRAAAAVRLGIPADAPVYEIKKAHRALSLIHHPDKGGNVDTFREIQESYELLRSTSGPVVVLTPASASTAPWEQPGFSETAPSAAKGPAPPKPKENKWPPFAKKAAPDFPDVKVTPQDKKGYKFPPPGKQGAKKAAPDFPDVKVPPKDKKDTSFLHRWNQGLSVLHRSKKVCRKHRQDMSMSSGHRSLRQKVHRQR
jgi:hypothetical protein